MYFSARNEIIQMLKDIDDREDCLDNIRNVVLGMKEDNEIKKRKIQIQDLAQYLQKITITLSESMDNFVNSFKQFGKTFVYDQMVRKLYLSIGLFKSYKEREVRDEKYS